MIGTGAGLLEFQAILILKTFALHALPSRAMGISKTFCDIVGIVPGGTLIGVKLFRSVSHPFTAEQVRRFFWPEILAMKICCPDRPCRLELWICGNQGRWQFFEISGSGVREVQHAAPP